MFIMKVKRKWMIKEKHKKCPVWVQLPKGKWPLQVGNLKNIEWNHFICGFILNQAAIFSLMLNLALLGDSEEVESEAEMRGGGYS